MSAPSIVSIGEPLVEFNETRARRYLQGFGGDTSNVAIAAARAGATVAYVTRIGEDEFGRMLLALWKKEGIDTSGVAMDPHAPTGAYFVSHGARGHVFSYVRTGSAASLMRPENLPLALLRGAQIVHASGISLAISPAAADTALAAFLTARMAGARISFDANLRLGLWPLPRARALIGAAAGVADYFFLSLDDARSLSGLDDAHAILDWAHRLGAKAVLLKLGARGAVISDGTGRARIAGLHVRSVDATGAGDCFCGAALARLAAGDSVFEAAHYANAAAALSTTGIGAVAPVPWPVAVRTLLRQSATHPPLPARRRAIRRRGTAPRRAPSPRRRR